MNVCTFILNVTGQKCYITQKNKIKLWRKVKYRPDPKSLR